MPFPGYPAATDATNALLQENEHPDRHNALAVAVNYLQDALDALPPPEPPWTFAITKGDRTGNFTTASIASPPTTPLTGASVAIAAVVGDVLECEFFGSMVSSITSGGARGRFAAAGVGIGESEGDLRSGGLGTAATVLFGKFHHSVQPGDLDAGEVTITFLMAAVAASTLTVHNNATRTWTLSVKNLGPPDGP